MEAINMTAMREALKLCGSRMCRLCKELELARSMLNKRALGVFCHSDKCKAFQAAHAALALPLRQCDVGTAEEQLARFITFCKGQRLHSSGHADTCNPKCPCRDGGDLNLCALTWAQMPYEEVSAK